MEIKLRKTISELNNTIQLNLQKIAHLEEELKNHIALTVMKKTEEELLNISEKYRQSLEQEELTRDFKNKEIMLLKMELDGFKDIKERLNEMMKNGIS